MLNNIVFFLCVWCVDRYLLETFVNRSKNMSFHLNRSVALFFILPFFIAALVFLARICQKFKLLQCKIPPECLSSCYSILLPSNGLYLFLFFCQTCSHLSNMNAFNVKYNLQSPLFVCLSLQ